MTTYRVGSDVTGGASNCVDIVCSMLENAGHTATNLGVNSNLEGSLVGADVGVFIINGMCLGTWHSTYDDVVKTGKCKQVIFAIPWVLFKGNEKFNKSEDLTDPAKKLRIVRDGTNWPAHYYDDDGKWTVAEAFQQYDGVDYVEGKTCEDVANAILSGNFGGGGSSSTQSTKEGSIMSGWESITDLLKPLDGEAMVVVRGDSVIIKRIYPPESTKLWIYEGINVVDDSVTISDYSPEIYNTFVINWGAEYENQMEVSFTKHKELFGERKTEVKAHYQVPEGEEPVWMTESGEEETTESEGGSVWDSIMGFFGGGGGQGTIGGSSEDIAKNLGMDNEMSTGTGEDVQYSDVPITDEAEALLFGLKTVGRARRKDGHQIECKVIGSKYWEVGEWAKVYLPSFNEDTIMFISKVNHESGADSEWITSLTLVDYPPSLGSGQSNTPSSDTSTEQTEQGVLNSLPNDANENTDNTNNGDNN